MKDLWWCNFSVLSVLKTIHSIFSNFLIVFGRAIIYSSYRCESVYLNKFFFEWLKIEIIYLQTPCQTVIWFVFCPFDFILAHYLKSPHFFRSFSITYRGLIAHKYIHLSNVSSRAAGQFHFNMFTVLARQDWIKKVFFRSWVIFWQCFSHVVAQIYIISHHHQQQQ